MDTPVLILLIPVFLLVIASLVKERILLPIILLYSVIPLRYWSDFNVNLPGIGKLTLDTILAIVAIVLMLIRIVFMSKPRVVHPTTIWITWTFLGVSFVSASLVGMTGESAGFRMLVRVAFPALVFLLVTSEYRSERQIERVMSIFLTIGVMISLWLLLIESLTGKELWHWSAGVMRFGALGSISDHAFLMALLTILGYSRLRNGGNRILNLILILVFATQGFFTLTRGAIFGMVLGLVAVELFGRRGNITGRAMLVSSIITASFFAVLLYEPLNQRVFATHYKDVSSQSNLSTSGKLRESFEKSGRESLWKFVIDRVGTSYHIFTGYGVGRGEVDITRYAGGVPHNEYIRVLYEMGAIGLILFIASLIQFWRIARSGVYEAKSDIQKMVSAACIGIIILYASGALVDNMINKYKNMGGSLFMFIAFVSVLLAKQKRQNRQVKEERS